MEALKDLALLLYSRTPIIIIESLEEVRLLQLFARLGLRLDHPMFQWSITEGLKRLEADLPAQQRAAGPDEVLQHIKALARPGYFLLLDFHPYLQDPLHIRLIKEIAQGHETTPRTLVFLSHAIDTPPELRHLTARFSLQLPDSTEVKRLIMDEARQWQGRQRRKIDVDHEAVNRLAATLTGVTTSDARRLIRHAIEDDGAISREDLPKVTQAKYELLNNEGIISFVHDSANFSEIAGLTNLKEWLSHRHQAFTGKQSGLDKPKGILLLGVQGGGKSLAAKAVAGTFGVPLLHLDFAALYNKYIGETEKNLRHALSLAEAMAPCVLWIDELEKGIAESDADSGLSRRILGSLLTWMAEQHSGVFIVATANDISRLPPELVRKGRLDEIFFIDLPAPDVRQKIFDIHLRRRNLAPSGFDLESLAAASDGYTGAEIEQAVVSALYTAHARGSRLDTDQLLESLGRTQPLSVVMAEQVQALRHWAEKRTVPAG